MDTSLPISVIICTYNRADRLRLALEALQTQTLPQEQFEIVVVDNASTDDTKVVCDRCLAQLPNLRYHFEAVQGLSRARNTGLQLAQGEFVAYLDDDAIPCPQWLQALLNGFMTLQPEPVAVGGPISPLWEITPPAWMHHYVQGYYTVLDFGSVPRWFPPGEFPYGANMAYQRQALIDIGGFAEGLGRKGESLLSEEERLANLTLQKQGRQFYYIPDASVQHWIPQQRLNRTWLLQRCYWQGRSVAVVDRLIGKSPGRQRWESFQGLINPRRWGAQLLPDAQRRIRTQTWLVWQWGYFWQTWITDFLVPVGSKS